MIAKLADFGLSSYLDIGTDEEKPPGSFDATAVGTKVYMSPEAEKGRVSPTVDVYAFGMVAVTKQMSIFVIHCFLDYV